MTMTVHVDIVSAEKEIFSGSAEMVFAPAEMGEVGISPRHAPLISKLKLVKLDLKPLIMKILIFMYQVDLSKYNHTWLLF